MPRKTYHILYLYTKLNYFEFLTFRIRGVKTVSYASFFYYEIIVCTALLHLYLYLISANYIDFFKFVYNIHLSFIIIVVHKNIIIVWFLSYFKQTKLI